MRRWYTIALGLAVFLCCPASAIAEICRGEVIAKSPEVAIQIFGSLKTYPHILTNVDFNDDQTEFDKIGDDNGDMGGDGVSVRNEARIGLEGSGAEWSFFIVLEADFTLDQLNVDRGDGGGKFGIEKLEYTYDFGPFMLETGWKTKNLDMQTGGIVYGDDHPYIGLVGRLGKEIAWEVRHYVIVDDISTEAGGKLDSDSLDWRAYAAKVKVPVGRLTMSPFYAYSDNDAHDAQAHYLGAEVYGMVGMFIPRAEFVHVTGQQQSGLNDRDIRAWGAFAALELNVSPEINPYIGGYYLSGDGDADDDDIDAFNGITNVSRFTPAFGFENGFIYRLVPALGSHLYSNVSSALELLGLPASNGYGGVANSSAAESPGLVAVGGGVKGISGKFTYKTQFQYFWFEDTGALEDISGADNVDEEMGWEFDLQLTYKFSKHFSLGNTIAFFKPGDGIQDLLGDDFDETAVLNTIELKWAF